jgi:purine-nucleoside/S-methyl-5'-thioadenosine phosphorylase / adenosine deaminase
MRKIIQCPELQEFKWLIHGSTTRAFNPVSADRKTEIENLAELWNIDPVAILFAKQTHSINSAFIEAKNLKQQKKTFIFDNTDSVGTEVPEVLATVFTADCVPIFLVDTWERRFMLIHAGWRGTLDLITDNAMDQLLKRGAKAENIIAWIGPSIDQCCYEVSEELASEFSRKFPDLPEAVKGRFLDLKKINAHSLEKFGVSEKNIHISSLCTKCRSDLFYSYRADGEIKGRILNAAMIRG